MTPQAALQRVVDHREIFHDEMVSLMRQIMSGEVSPVMIAAIITGLRVKKETIGEIAVPITMLVSTHDMKLVQELFPRTIVMDEGRVVADGLTIEILEDETFLTAHGLEKP